MVLQDETLAPTNQAVQPQDFLKAHERKFLEEQQRYKREAVDQGIASEFGRTLTADEVRQHVSPEMARTWIDAGNAQHTAVLEDRLNEDYALERYGAEQTRLWERQVIRSRPIGFWESMTTNVLGQERTIGIALPFFSVGAEGAGYYDLVRAAKADSAGTATQEQIRLLEDAADWNAREREAGWATAGTILGEAPAFLAEFATGGKLITGLAGAGVRRGGLMAVETALKKYGGLQIAAKAVQAKKLTAATKLGRIAQGTGRAGVAGAYQLGAQTAVGEVVGGVATGFEGGSRLRSAINTELLERNFDIGTDEALRLYTEAVDDQGLLDVLPKALVDGYIEMFSESMGPALREFIPALNITALRKLSEKVGIKKAREVLEKAGFNGVVEELGEEFLGGVLREGAAQLDPETFAGLEGSLDQFTDWREVLGMAAGFAGISGTAAGVGFAGDRLFRKEGKPVEEGAPERAEPTFEMVQGTREALPEDPARVEAAGQRAVDAVNRGLETIERPEGEPAPQVSVATEYNQDVADQIEAARELGIDVIPMEGMPTGVPGQFVEPGVVALNANAEAYVPLGALPSERPWYKISAVFLHERVHDLVERLKASPEDLRQLFRSIEAVSPERFQEALEHYNNLRRSQGLADLELQKLTDPEASAYSAAADEATAFIAQQLVPYMAEIGRTGDTRVLETLLNTAPKNLIEKILDKLAELANLIPGLNIDTRGIKRLREALREQGAELEAEAAQGDLRARAAYATILAEAFEARPLEGSRPLQGPPQQQGPPQLQGPPQRQGPPRPTPQAEPAVVEQPTPAPAEAVEEPEPVTAQPAVEGLGEVRPRKEAPVPKVGETVYVIGTGAQGKLYTLRTISSERTYRKLEGDELGRAEASVQQKEHHVANLGTDWAASVEKARAKTGGQPVYATEFSLHDIQRQAVGLLKFGKYRGKHIADVAVEDPGYVDWLVTSNNLDKKQNALIKRHMEELGIVGSPEAQRLVAAQKAMVRASDDHHAKLHDINSEISEQRKLGASGEEMGELYARRTQLTEQYGDRLSPLQQEVREAKDAYFEALQARKAGTMPWPSQPAVEPAPVEEPSAAERADRIVADFTPTGQGHDFGIRQRDAWLAKNVPAEQLAKVDARGRPRDMGIGYYGGPGRWLVYRANDGTLIRVDSNDEGPFLLREIDPTDPLLKLNEESPNVPAAEPAEEARPEDEELSAKDRAALDDFMGDRFALSPAERKKELQRDPELQQALGRLRKGEITREQYQAELDRLKPTTVYADVPEPATLEEMRSALHKNKEPKIGAADELDKGHPVGLRLDIPAYKDHGIWVPTIHEGRGTPTVIGYNSVAAVTEPVFGMREPEAERIALGGKKTPFAVIKGKWASLPPAAAKHMADRVLRDPSWVQVGMNPEKHSYFFDRETQRPVLSGDRAIQVGPLILVQNPVYGEAAQQRFALAPGGQAPPFFSAVERAVAGFKQDRLSVAQLNAATRKEPGVTDDELAWVDWEGLLAGRKRVTKEEALEWLRANGIEVRERVLGVGAYLGREDTAEMARLDAMPPSQRTDADWARLRELREAEASTTETGRVAPDPRHPEYQLPGGENYRELLLVLPHQDPHEERAEFLRETERRLREEGISEAELAEWNAVRAGKPYEPKKPSFTAGHYGDIPNVLAHVRFNERVDSEGRRVLFIEEIQSDWHQEGRKKGYAGESNADALAAKYDLPKDRGRWSLDVLEGAGVSQAEQSAWWDAHMSLTSVPDAPFKTTWPTLALKRAIKWAADNGFDSVAWTTGQQQVERYKTSYRQAVDSIGWLVLPNDLGRQVDARKGGESVGSFIVDGQGVVTAAGRMDSAVGKPLEDVVGKEIAKRIMSEDSGTVEGEGLTIGGKGMQDFYDKILRNAANKLGKRFGVKVGRASIQTNEIEQVTEWTGELLDTLVGDVVTASVHSLPLTDEMRSTVREQGFSTFGSRFALGWHATGAEFDEFSTEFMGTGEGAQAYGWGLYFATKRAVGEWYRARFAGRIVFVHGSGRRFDGTTPTGSQKRAKKKASRKGGAAPAAASGPPSVREIESHAYQSLQGMGDSFFDGAYRPTPELVREIAREAAEHERDLAASQTGYGGREMTARERAVHLGAAKILEDIGSVDGGEYKLKIEGGHLLQVDLAPAEEDYLLWDRPLSEQSEKVREALKPIVGESVDQLSDMELLAEFLRSDLVEKFPDIQEVRTAKNAWREGGEFVRDWAEKQRRTEGMAFNLFERDSGGTIYQRESGRLRSDRAASQALLAAGIRGIKYLDGTSRAAGEGSYNYVIFDAADVEISGRFALAPPVDSPEFRAWFGDSKVVGDDGQPLVVYHGTASAFTAFSEDVDPSTLGGEELRGVHYFSEDPRTASGYAETVVGKAASVMPVYLSLQNPLILDARRAEWGPRWTRRIARAKDGGYDGVIIRRIADEATHDYGEVPRASDQYIAFTPTQIKSATGNVGAYDPADPDIRRALGPAVDSRRQFDAEDIHSRAGAIAEEFLDTGVPASEAAKGLVRKAWSTVRGALANAGGIDPAVYDPKAAPPEALRSALAILREADRQIEPRWKVGAKDIDAEARYEELDIRLADAGEQVVGPGMTEAEALEAQRAGDTRFALAPASLSDRLGLDGKLSVNWEELADDWVIRMADRLLPMKQIVDMVRKTGAKVTDAMDSYQRATLMHGRVQDQVDGVLSDFVKPIVDILRRLKVPLKEWGEYAMLRHVEERNRFFVEQQELNAANEERIEALEERLYEDLSTEEKRQVRKDIKQLQRQVDAWQKRSGGKQYVKNSEALTELNKLRQQLEQPREGKELTADEKRQHRDKIAKLAKQPMPASGVNTQDAKERLAKFEEKYNAKQLVKGWQPVGLREAGELLDKMNQSMLDLQRDNGLISEAEHQEYSERWDHYVPLQTAEVDEDAFRTPSAKSLQVKGKEFEMARGRTTEADNPFVWSVQQAFRSIERGERNRVGEAFAQLVEAHPDLLADKAKIERLKEGQEAPEDSFTFKRNGKEFVVRVDAKLARAMKALDYASVPKLLQFLRPVMTWLRRAATSWNPDFILPNFARDLSAGLIVLSKQEADGVRSTVLKYTLSTKPQRAILDAMAVRDGRLDPATLEGERLRWMQHAQEFIAAGGKSAWHFTQSFEDMRQDLTKQIETPSETDGVLTLAKAKEAVAKLDRFNEAIENGVRLSTFVALQERGFTADNSAAIAKDLTVNFNRQGEWGPYFNLLYMFYNAGAQGILTMKRAALDGDAAAQKRVGKMLAGLVALGVTQELYNQLLGGDDDETGQPKIDGIPDWKQETNLVLLNPLGEGALTIPLPYGFNVFHRLGRAFARTAFFGENFVEEALDTLAVGAESANPIGASPTLLHFMSPTLSDPIVDIATNVKFSGSPVHPASPGFGPQPVQSSQSYTNTGTVVKWMAEAMNTVTGGDHYEAGIVDVYPDTLEHLFEFAIGGTGRTIGNAYKTAKQALLEGPSALDIDDVPIVRRFLTAAPEWMLRSDYYEAIKDIDMQNDRLDHYKEIRNFEYRRELMKDNRAVIGLKGYAKESRKRVADLRKRLVAAQEAGNRSLEETLEKRLEREYKQAMRRYVGAVDRDR